MHFWLRYLVPRNLVGLTHFLQAFPCIHIWFWNIINTLEILFIIIVHQLGDKHLLTPYNMWHNPFLSPRRIGRYNIHIICIWEKTKKKNVHGFFRWYSQKHNCIRTNRWFTKYVDEQNWYWSKTFRVKDKCRYLKHPTNIVSY